MLNPHPTEERGLKMNSQIVKIRFTNPPVKNKMLTQSGKIVSLLLMFIALSTISQAQNKTADKHNEQVLIVGSVDPSVNQSYKINLMPEAPEMPKVNKEFDFKPINKYFYTPVAFKPIKAVSIRADKPGDIYNNMVKAGFGSRLTPYAEFFHSQTHKGKFRFDAHLKHISTYGKIKDYSPAPSSLSLAEASFDKFFRYQTLTVEGGYRYSTNRYYYAISDFPNIDDSTRNFKQAYSLAFFNTSLTSHYKSNDKLHHKVGLSSYYYFNKYQTSELYTALDFDFHKSYRVTNILEYQYLGLEGGAEYYNNTDTTINTSDIYINVTPYYKASYGIFRFKAGVNLAFLKADSVSKFKIYPDVEINVNLFPGYLQLYTGINGGLQKISYRKLTEENPFISMVVSDRWLNNKIGVYGGLKGNINKQVGFNIKTAWRKFENEYFFVNIPSQIMMQAPGMPNELYVVSDTGSVFTVKAQISYQYSNQLNLYASYVNNTYSLSFREHPYGKLLSELKVGGSYLIATRFKPWMELVYVGKRWYFSGLDTNGFIADELPEFFDLNLGLEYYYDDHFSGFIKATNILNNHYDYFYGHPNYGIEIMLGISYKF